MLLPGLIRAIDPSQAGQWKLGQPGRELGQCSLWLVLAGIWTLLIPTTMQTGMARAAMYQGYGAVFYEDTEALPLFNQYTETSSVLSTSSHTKNTVYIKILHITILTRAEQPV